MWEREREIMPTYKRRPNCVNKLKRGRWGKWRRKYNKKEKWECCIRPKGKREKGRDGL